MKNGIITFQTGLKKSLENKMVNVIPEHIKSKSFLKKQAHCRECSKCWHDNFFRSYRCSFSGNRINLIDFACKHFYYKFANIKPNWENEFLFGIKKQWIN